jgi:hypothetical protein
MAKLKATPKSFAEAATMLGNRDSIRLGNNTHLIRLISTRGRLAYAVRFHATNIVVFHDNGEVTLHTCGYRTVTTKERINQFIRPLGRIHQDAGTWYYSALYPDGAVYAQQVFKDGLVIQR